MKKSLCFIILTMLFIPFLSTPKSYAEERTEYNVNDISKLKIPKIETSNWQTVPIGRYLINLPPTAKITWLPLTFQGKHELVWKKDMTMEEGRKLLTEEAIALWQELKKGLR